MPITEEPDKQSAEPETGRDSIDSVSLVDLFDQLDRASFRRALELRDNVFPLSNRR